MLMVMAVVARVGGSSRARLTSMTVVMPGMVSEVSATLVARITLRAPGGAGAKTRACSSDGNEA